MSRLSFYGINSSATGAHYGKSQIQKTVSYTHLHEGVDTDVKGSQRKGYYQIGFLGKAEGFEDGKDTVGAHKLRTVQQSKSFLMLSPKATERIITEAVEAVKDWQACLLYTSYFSF